jgi:8-oxo-dGTP pyrophosphatase MutT (NUDIX family)
MKKLSCGGVIFSPQHKLLIARPRWDSPHWNIPKGELRPGESPRACAIREIEEETGIKPSMYQYIFDIGQHPYLKTKDVYMFHMYLNTTPTKLVCSSFYEENGKKYPEMVDFKWIEWEERDKFVSPPIRDLLNRIEILLI